MKISSLQRHRQRQPEPRTSQSTEKAKYRGNKLNQYIYILRYVYIYISNFYLSTIYLSLSPKDMNVFSHGKLGWNVGTRLDECTQINQCPNQNGDMSNGPRVMFIPWLESVMPKCSMHGIFTYIYLKHGLNVGR